MDGGASIAAQGRSGYEEAVEVARKIEHASSRLPGATKKADSGKDKKKTAAVKAKKPAGRKRKWPSAIPTPA